MRGNVGPYVQIDGPGIWVPRTVPYLEPRRVAADAAQGGERLRYLGKVEAKLLGFVAGCHCDEECERVTRCDETTGWDEVDTGDRSCYVPAWAFELVAR